MQVTTQPNEAEVLLQNKLGLIRGVNQVRLSREEAKVILNVIKDLSKRNRALEMENTNLSLFGGVVRDGYGQIVSH